jgi:uncharacterized protein DUF4336
MLQAIGPDLFTATSMMRFPAGVELPIRMVVARLPDGSLVLVSPIPMDDALAAEVAALGPVRYLVGPNLLHHLSLGPARERFPDATLYGAPGLAAKRSDLAFDGAIADAPWGDALGAHLVAGAPRINEVVLHHAASSTLIATDLLFNIRTPANRRTAVVLAIAGTRGRLAKSREWMFLVKDRAAFRQSLDRILALPFERVVMAHGDVVESDGRADVARVLGRA